MTPRSFLVRIPFKVEVHLVKTHQGRLRRIVFDNQRHPKGIKNNGENNFCYSHRLIHLFGYQSVNPLILLLVKKCDYVPQRYLKGRFSLDLVTFLVGESCVKCDKMRLLSASQHHFPVTYQIEFKELTKTTVIVDNKDN